MGYYLWRRLLNSSRLYLRFRNPKGRKWSLCSHAMAVSLPIIRLRLLEVIWLANLRAAVSHLSAERERLRQTFFTLYDHQYDPPPTEEELLEERKRAVGSSCQSLMDSFHFQEESDHYWQLPIAYSLPLESRLHFPSNCLPIREDGKCRPVCSTVPCPNLLRRRLSVQGVFPIPVTKRLPG
jgi:hypothetical protein